ncbi:tRNA pseudouridine synthase B [Moraxella macacae 0408225]|uniref:tRNA pseudouridine synthase B n=1 Tax=Moraxella macacae 0408225 TaxID=1230338 RepID=L2F9E7_9GAMM|nr:tRNA pseudouridine(55) synthase TruB [Moraxella macacae]ELA09689.1 tRNA pseudouridine synthase B [Moraxella macacae 0408225]
MTKTIVSGVILIDKPQGLTSQQVVSKVKFLLKSPIFNSKKAGHTGTLDPMATGLLPICLGEATKFSHYQLDANKTYEAIVKLGAKTDTGDADGQIIATKEVLPIHPDTLQKVTNQFLGIIPQIPPMYSALKKDGKKLYELARQGIQIERKAREIEIFSLKLALIDKDLLKLVVTCSKGTYVRVLGEDIARSLGTLGHLVALRRIKTGNFDIVNAITLDALERLDFAQRFEWLKPIDACVKFLPKLVLNDEQSVRTLQGQRLNVKNHALAQNVLADTTQEIRLFTANGKFLGVASLEPNGRLQPLKLVNV